MSTRMKRWTWVLLALVVLAAAAVVVLPRLAGSTAGLPAEIDVQRASRLRDEGAVVLDVRQPDEWEAGHIPGAVLIPLDQLPARLAEVPKDRAVVVMCRSGNRSQAGRDILLQAGYASVTSMAGGIRQWQGAGLPVVSGP